MNRPGKKIHLYVHCSVLIFCGMHLTEEKIKINNVSTHKNNVCFVFAF